MRGRADARLAAFLSAFVVLFSFLLYRLWDMQMINGQAYADRYELKITKTIRDKGMRGAIYDRDGEALAWNEPVYTVEMTDEGNYDTDRERQLSLNGAIYRVICKLKEQGETVCREEWKVRQRAGGGYEYSVSGEALERFLADAFSKPGPSGLSSEQRAVSANELMRHFASNDQYACFGSGKSDYGTEERKAYGLPSQYGEDDLLSLVAVRHMLSKHAYKKYVPVRIARDVSEETAAFIWENQDTLAGICVGTDFDRVYAGGAALSHILGYTGKISSEELQRQEAAGRNYAADAVVGKAGMEQYLEETLFGADGEREIMVNNVGKVIGEERVIREAKSGADARLSIDKGLQVAVYRILEQKLAGILAQSLIPAKTFDKQGVSDASQIRIPVLEVCAALIENGIVHTQDLRAPDATKLEQKLAGILMQKKAEACGQIAAELLETDEGFGQLSEEMKEYADYLVEETGILNEEAVKNWEREKEAGVRKFFTQAAECGQTAEGALEFGQGYVTGEEMSDLFKEAALKKLESDEAFERLLLKRLVWEEKVSAADVCLLLYDQDVLPLPDGDYEELAAGRTDAFSFLKKKIEQLQITPAQLALDPCSASAVVLNPSDGSVLALVSYPGYDNGRLANQMDSEYYNELLHDKSLPLYNRAAWQLTAPGSTLKPVTIVAGLAEGVIDADTSMACDGIFDKVEPGLRCWKHEGHGTVAKAPDALRHSCNDYMCEIAYRLGTRGGPEYADKAALGSLQEYAGLFCLDQKSGVEIAEAAPHVTDAYGIPSAIGQGTHNYATVQLARYAGAIASRGSAFSLSLILETAKPGGEAVSRKPELLKEINLPDSVWDVVHQGMLQFAQNNEILKDMKIEAAGKTGTAQEAKRRPDHALFIGFAPASRPEIALAVRIANGYGSSNATAVGKDILNYYFKLESPESILTGKAAQAQNTSTD